jgi:hypothetical protein
VGKSLVSVVSIRARMRRRMVLSCEARLLSEGMYTKLGNCLLISERCSTISSRFSFFGFAWSTFFGIESRSFRKTRFDR